MAFVGPYSRQVEMLDRIADAITHSDVLEPATTDRTNDSLQRLAEYFEENNGIPGAGDAVQADWSATSGPSAILNKPTMQELIDSLEQGGTSFDDAVGVTTATEADIDELFE